MTLEGYRLYSNKIAICLIPIFVFVVFCMFIIIDGSILANQFSMGWKGYGLVAAILLPSAIPVGLYVRFALKQMRFYTERSDFLVPFHCYLTCLILFGFDCVLVTIMPIKFCGIIGQVAFSICLLIIGNSVSWKMYIPANFIYGICVMAGSYFENKLTPPRWAPWAADIVYLPSYITIPTVWLIMVAISLLNYINEADTKKNYKVLEDLDYRNNRDPLTKCYNRNMLKLKEIRGYGLIMLDIDHFKRLNDEYGHDNGDKSLSFMADVILQCIRKDNDLAIRYGGEEFLIVIKGLPPGIRGMEVLGKIAETIRSSIEIQTLRASTDHKSLQSPFTVSLGANLWIEGMTLEENIKVVDSYLYCAKESGRNKVCYPNLDKIPEEKKNA